MSIAVRIVAALVLVIAAGRTALPHHSIVGQFDVSRTVTLTGTIARVDWINPHAYVHVIVREKGGRMTTWAVSTPPIAMLRKMGISKESLAGKPGETVTIAGYPALNGTPMAWMSKITYADGRFLAIGE